ncbi:MAG: GNAT family N-acetyltransferase [Jhaorihella sp.]
MSTVRIAGGFFDPERERLAALYWQAFGAKLGRVMTPKDKALQFIAGGLDPSHSLIARDAAGTLLGGAGYKTAHGAFLGGTLADMQRVWGWWGGTWRGVLLAPLERKVQPGTLLMDGIFVEAAARGTGIGGLLLQAVKDRARELGLSRVRLDVIDTNPRARALYERSGFRATETHATGPLRVLFGFRYSTTMDCQVA